MTLTPEQERSFVAELEKLGEAQVRSNLERGKISPAVEYVALAWVAEREREAKASQSEQMELTRRASIAAEQQALEARRANTRANWALAIAIASMIVAVIGIGITHWDALK